MSQDILLFQELGINTIRVYSVNTDLNHDACMSMLAAAGVYLALDVNSPIPNHHLNRYEPWNSYNVEYLENVFKVVEQFSYYNNTLGFFAGNEVINDITSAKNSAVYVKAMVRDIKNYISYNSPRPIPVGYSAADDLNFRISFSSYLQCMDESPSDSVDFYGVNSYQWCGDQTFYTSGYDSLVNDYLSYSRPVFLSEYGCNLITPRQFGEVPTLYSNDMVDVFSGGLVYEFSQEPNSYGLVELSSNGDVKLLEDFLSLKRQFDALPEIDYHHVAQAMRQNAKEIQSIKKFQRFGLQPCDETYEHIDISRGIPKSLADDLVDFGVEVQRGRFISLSEQDFTCAFNILDPKGQPYPISKTITPIIDHMSGVGYDKFNRVRHKSGMYNGDESKDENGVSEWEYSDSDASGSETDSESMGNKDETIFSKASTYLANAFHSIANIFSHS
ncbi:Glycolipid anchored surface protein 4 precursor [Yamadazyma tenuis]|uniref:Glycolipid anchored surface protein 4 precursor n=1 Tax=Candida tenuis TaxID=2315449 RepID=UPI00279A9CBD|nr:Glycolipid anchored surface protein 4 precursor [Yamadazyma tenuis]